MPVKMKPRDIAKLTGVRPPKRKPAKRGPSHLEERFASYWMMLKGPALHREYVFAPPRKWRFDFAHVPSKLAFEMEGGIWIHGGHSRPSAVIRDAEKFNAAALAGWRVIRLHDGIITAHEVERLIEHVTDGIPTESGATP